MGKNTSIEWAHHTLNGLRGCNKKLALLAETDPDQGYHPSGCDGCYAMTMSYRNPRTLGIWGLFGTRVPASDATWKAVLQWDREAGELGERHRVFAYSLGDVGEMPLLELEVHQRLFGFATAEQVAIVKRNQAICDAARARLFEFVERCPNLDFLLLTKRPEYMGEIVPKSWHENPPANWWQGVSISTQRDADERLPLISALRAAVRFVSFEPLLECIDFGIDVDSTSNRFGLLTCSVCNGFGAGEVASPVGGDPYERDCGWCGGSGSSLDWALIGGESGGIEKARDCEYSVIRSMLMQIEIANVVPFVKQVGRNPVDIVDGQRRRLKLIDKKGGDLDELPEDLRIREIPSPRIHVARRQFSA